MRISDWSSDVCSSDLKGRIAKPFVEQSKHRAETLQAGRRDVLLPRLAHGETPRPENRTKSDMDRAREKREPFERASALHPRNRQERSEEHTSELQSLMRSSYAVFCLEKKKNTIKRKS